MSNLSGIAGREYKGGFGSPDSTNYVKSPRDGAGSPFRAASRFGDEAHVWDDFFPVVAPYYRTIAVGRRGHGKSDG